VLEINGHNIRQILDALEVHSKPVVILAHTAKGKGVSFMEHTAQWRGAVPNAAQYQAARSDFERKGRGGRV